MGQDHQTPFAPGSAPTNQAVKQPQTSLPELPEHDSARLLRCIPFVGLMSLMYFVDLVLALGIRVREEEAAGVLIGSCFAQIVASAILTAWAPWPLHIRIPMGVILMAYSSTCLTIIGQRDGGSDIGIVIGGAMVAQWTLYQAPLWLARFKGWSLQRSHGGRKVDPHETQFGIRHIMLWTAIVGLFLGSLRAIGTFVPLGEIAGARGETQIFVILTLFNSVMAMPLIWGGFANRNTTFWLAAAILWIALLTVFELFALRDTPAQAIMFILINIVQSIAIGAMVGTLRLAGLRLHRTT